MPQIDIGSVVCETKYICTTNGRNCVFLQAGYQEYMAFEEDRSINKLKLFGDVNHFASKIGCHMLSVFLFGQNCRAANNIIAKKKTSQANKDFRFSCYHNARSPRTNVTAIKVTSPSILPLTLPGG